MSRDAVTTDLRVLQKWPQPPRDAKRRDKVGYTAQMVAHALGLTSFQITARLKGMEGRGLVRREMGTKGGPDKSWMWFRTETGIAEAEHPSPSLLAAANPAARAPRIRTAGGAVGLPDDRKVKRVHSTKIKDGWRLLDRRMGEKQYVNVLVAPDGREYVKANPFEAADLITEWPKDTKWNYSMFPPSRWRLLAGSKVQTRARKHDHEQTKRAEARAARRKSA